MLHPYKHSRCIKASVYISEEWITFLHAGLQLTRIYKKCLKILNNINFLYAVVYPVYSWWVPGVIIIHNMSAFLQIYFNVRKSSNQLYFVISIQIFYKLANHCFFVVTNVFITSIMVYIFMCLLIQLCIRKTFFKQELHQNIANLISRIVSKLKKILKIFLSLHWQSRPHRGWLLPLHRVSPHSMLPPWS